jgi:hypothetical protein
MFQYFICSEYLFADTLFDSMCIFISFAIGSGGSQCTGTCGSGGNAQPQTAETEEFIQRVQM